MTAINSVEGRSFTFNILVNFNNLNENTLELRL